MPGTNWGFDAGGTIIIEKNAFIHVSTHAEGGTVIIKGDVEGRVGGQMVKGEMYVLGEIKFMMPGYQKVDTVEKEVDGVKATFDHYIGDLGERHGKSKGQVVYANLYAKVLPDPRHHTYTHSRIITGTFFYSPSPGRVPLFSEEIIVTNIGKEFIKGTRYPYYSTVDLVLRVPEPPHELPGKEGQTIIKLPSPKKFKVPDLPGQESHRGL